MIGSDGLRSLVEALESCGYSDIRDPDEDPYWVWMKIVIGGQKLTVVVGEAPDHAPGHFRLRASVGPESVDRIIADTDDNTPAHEALIRDFEAKLLLGT